MSGTFTTISDLYGYITEAIEGGGAASADEYDLDAIAHEIAEFDRAAQAFVVTADTDEFWASVEAHCIGEAADIVLAGVEHDTLRIIAGGGGPAALHSETLGCWLPADDARAADNSITTPADWQDPAAQYDTAAAALAAAKDPGFWAEQPAGVGQIIAVVEPSNWPEGSAAAPSR